MDRSFRLTRWLTLGGLAAVGAGLVLLLGQAIREVAAEPSLSLEDGYWIGRLPWTAVGVDLVVIGATVAAVAGTIAAWIAGGWAGRVVTAVAAGLAAFWWSVVTLLAPGGASCAGCPAPGFDPFTTAYSLPQMTLALLVGPATVIGLAVLSKPSHRPYTPAATASSQMNTT